MVIESSHSGESVKPSDGLGIITVLVWENTKEAETER